jgi:predicted nucleic acid-binding protein
MRFWDSSAIVPLLIEEDSTSETTVEYVRDPEIVVWWATEVECASALARLDREARLDRQEVTAGFDRLDGLARAWQEIQPVARIRPTANRLLRVHALRAADAFQLAAAITAAEDRPSSLRVVTLDVRLAQAAEREGFRVVVPNVGSAR